MNVARPFGYKRGTDALAFDSAPVCPFLYVCVYNIYIYIYITTEPLDPSRSGGGREKKKQGTRTENAGCCTSFPLSFVFSSP
jgi:hypothetical protein